MTKRLSLPVALLLATASSAVLAVAPAAETPAALAAAAHVDPAAVDRLYDRAVLGDGVPGLRAQLEAIGRSSAPAGQRASALAMAARVAWRAGDLAGATVAIDAALALRPDRDALLLKAQLADVGGAPATAAIWYRKARDAQTDQAARAQLDLRLALIEAVRRPETLAAWTRQQPSAAADRLAPVLALLGRPADALAVTQPPPPGPAGTVAALQTAEWAIAAGDTAVARHVAWQAYANAKSASDRRYALALLVEAYRDARDLAGAAAFLATKPPSAELTAARVDVLLELARSDEAIALIRRSSDPDLHARLLGILELAGHKDATVVEYRRLIATKPQRPEGYAGLAAIFVAADDRAQAIALFRSFGDANRGRPDALLRGASAMIDMGLTDQAIGMVTGDAAVARLPAAHRFLFEAYSAQGRPAEAAGELDALAREASGESWLTYAAQSYDAMGEPAKALALLRRLETPGKPAGYDLQLQMAGLAERAGLRVEALARWRQVWQAEALPARRSYAEGQIVHLARQTGTTDVIARELDARLAGGTLRPGDIGLLAALRMAQGDRTSAAAAITRYAAPHGSGEVARLEEVAGLYGRLGDHPALERTLRRLVEVDPANHEDHVRRLILDLVRYGDDTGPARRDELERLMAEAAHGDDDAAHLFRATVRAMNDDEDRALAEFRKAQAAAPQDPDALLQLATTLRGQGRRGEAGAMLAYAVAGAPSTGAFVTASGGLLDLIAGDAAGKPGDRPLPRRPTLRWVERLLLEQIAEGGVDARLLGLLTDVAQLLGDDDLQYRAYEGALAAAGEQRPAALRQLITLSSGGTAGAQADAASADARRKIVYGRRLLALHKSFPPDFYADLAGTLLTQGDEAGADRAFAMMTDMGGLVNVDEVKARAFASAGLPTAALANYARALARDQGNIDLVVRTSVLREQLGEGALAFPWYWRTLTRLIARQSDRPADDSSDGAVEVDRYLDTLVEGMLLTWPADPQAAAAAQAAIAQLAAASLAGIDRTAPGALASHRQLALMLDLMRHLHDDGRDGGAATAWEVQLGEIFANDPDYRRGAALHRDLTGAAPPVPAAPGWATATLRRQATDSDNQMLALVLAIEQHDDAAVAAMTASALAADVAWRDASARGFTPMSRPPMFLYLLPVLLDALPEDRARSIVLAPIDAAPVRDALLFDLYRGAYSQYARLEKIAGRPLMADDRLLTMLVERGNSPMNFSARAGMAWRGSASLQRFSVDQRIGLYDGLVTRMEQGGGESAIMPGVLERLLAAPLDAAQLARVKAILRRDLDFGRDQRQGGLMPVLQRLLLLDTARSNQAMLIESAQAAVRLPGARQVPAFLQAWFAGDRARAFSLLDAIDVAIRAQSRDDDMIDQIIAARFPDVRQQAIDAFLAAEKPDATQARRFYTRFVAPEAGTIDTDRLIAFYRKLIAVAPDEPDYRNGLLRLYWEKGMTEPFVQLLRDHVAAHSDDEDAALTLALTDRLLGRAVDEAAVARATGVDASDAGGVVQLLKRAESERGMPGRFAAVYATYAQRNPADEMVRAVAARRPSATTADAGTNSVSDRLRTAQAGAPATVPGLLRRLWRESIDKDSGGHPALLRVLAAAVAADGTDGQAMAAIVARPDVTAELDRYLTALDAEARATAGILYDLVARGLIAQRQGDARLDALLSALASGTLPGSDMPLLLALADRTGRTLDPAQRAALAVWLQATPALGLGTRVLVSGLFARAGDNGLALDLLRAALMQMLFSYTPLDDVGGMDMAGARIVAALRAWPDQAAAREGYATLLGVAQERTRGLRAGQEAPLPPFDPPALAAAASAVTTGG